MVTEKELMLSGELYDAGDSELLSLRKKAHLLADEYNQLIHTEEERALSLLPELFSQIGKESYIEKGLHVDYGLNTKIGDHFYANARLTLLDVATIEIGHHVLFGPNVSLLTAGHPIDVDIRNTGLEYGLPITIKDNVWLGGNVVINPGVTIGKNSVIGSGTVVTKDMPANSVIVGNPARVLRSIGDHDMQVWKAKRENYKRVRKGV